MKTKIIRVHDNRFGAYYVRVEVDRNKRWQKRIALALLGASALGLAAIATGFAAGPPVHTPKLPAGTNTNAGSGIVVDSAGHTIGQVMSPIAMVTLFKTNGLWFAPCFDINGFSVDPWVVFPTPDCSGTPFVADIGAEPAVECGQLSIPPTGGSLSYADKTQAQTITALSAGLLNPDGSMAGCTGQSGGQYLADPFTTITIPTFTPPFKLQ